MMQTRLVEAFLSREETFSCDFNADTPLDTVVERLTRAVWVGDDETCWAWDLPPEGESSLQIVGLKMTDSDDANMKTYEATFCETLVLRVKARAEWSDTEITNAIRDHYRAIESDLPWDDMDAFPKGPIADDLHDIIDAYEIDILGDADEPLLVDLTVGHDCTVS